MDKDEVRVDKVIDAVGSHCPGPLMELIKAIRQAKVGEIIAVYSSDSGSRTDIPLWVNKAGHKLLGIFERDGYTEFVVEKTR